MTRKPDPVALRKFIDRDIGGLDDERYFRKCEIRIFCQVRCLKEGKRPRCFSLANGVYPCPNSYGVCSESHEADGLHLYLQSSDAAEWTLK